jgi:hypothetical protein
MITDTPKRNPDWTAAELMVALDAYFNICRVGGRISSLNPVVIQASKVLNALNIHPLEKRNEKFRDPDGVRRRFGYFQKLEAGGDIGGRDAYQQVWARYKNDPAQLSTDAAEIKTGIFASAEELNPSNSEQVERDVHQIMEDASIDETEKIALAKARRGQGQFRRRLIDHWKGCAITGCKEQSLLVASHIKPWATSTNKERLDPFNGLLLNPTWDRLFDQGLVSFEDDGSLMISPYLSQNDRDSLNGNPPGN